MKKMILLCVLSIALVIFLALPVMAASVSQGKTVTYDPDKKLLVIEDYDTNFTKEAKYGSPTGQQSTYDLTGTMIGIPPKVGDVVRIAYDEKDNKRHAIKIMNVTKQGDLKK
jgi:hypothetical protein